MQVQGSFAPTIRCGLFEIDLAAGEVRKNGAKIKLQEQPFQVLAALLEAPGDVVSRDQLRRRLWPDDTFVDFDHGLNNAIAKIREAFDDSATNPRFVETLPKRGYRFIAPVQSGLQSASEIGPAPGALGPVTGSNRAYLYALAAAAVVLVLAGAFFYTGPWSVPPETTSGTSVVAKKPSIAVLPFTNLNEGEQDDYFSDGLTDAIIADLGAVTGLWVISGTSSVVYQETNKAVREIASELNVTHVVEGAVLRAENRVRITARLIDARSERAVWSNTYERPLERILTLQSEVATDIARGVEVELTPQEEIYFASRKEVSPEAHEAYLKGSYHFIRTFKGTEGDWERTIAYFQEAIEKESLHAPAHAALADLFRISAISGVKSSREAMPKAKAAAERAVELDPGLAEARATLGSVLMQFDWDWQAAERQINEAIRLNPSSIAARQGHFVYLLATQRFDEALREIHIAQELDPKSPLNHAYEGWGHFMAADYDAAIDKSLHTIEMTPNDWFTYDVLGVAYAEQGSHDKAAAALERAASLGGAESIVKAQLGYVYGLAGDRAKALGILQELNELSETQYVSPYFRAWTHAGLGNDDRVFELLEQAYEDRTTNMVFLKTERPFVRYQSHPRFQALAKKINFPD